MSTATTNLMAATIVTLALAAGADPVLAAETCGNGIDDDTNGMVDEGCGFANSVMGVCESPMSCAETGDIDPVTGAWVYRLPPDITPTVPYGPRLVFQRTYLSKYAPPSTNYRTAMGNRWNHNLQSWLDRSGTAPNRVAIVHLPTGQDVKFSESSTPGDGFTYYNTFQAGAHFKHLRQATASPNHWELKTLTGEVLKYNWASPVGKLIEQWDSLTIPNKLTIAYFTSGGNNGQINSVTDASGHKRFLFSYSQSRVSSVAYQTGSGSTWTTRVTLSLSYTMSNPTTVQIGGSTIQTNTYSSSYLTNIADGAGKTIVNVNYVAATPGKVANVTTGNGGIGFDYASSHAQCTGSTALFFNLATTGTCNVDDDCGIGTGFRCGGKRGSGSTGKCYRAARCLNTTSPSENLITTVTPFTPCTGACAPVAQYSWNTATLDLKGIKLPDNNWTSFQRDGNGMVTLMAEGDTDDNPANAGGVNEAKTWFFYGDTNFPGRLTEARRRTDTIVDNACSDISTSLCKQTLYSWNTDGLLGSMTEKGFTTDGAPYTYTTTYTYDDAGKGRLKLIDGPLSGTNDVTEFTFWASADVLKDGYTNLIRRKKDSSNYVVTTLDGYDNFGNAGATQDPDGTFTCSTWDINRNYLSQSRQAMNGQTSCATTHASDLVTIYVRDTSLRLTKTTNPLGDCQHQEYDSFGRPTNTKLRDDCVATNAGNTMTRSYNANGLKEITEWIDASGNVKKRIKGSFTDSMHIAGWDNPVSPSYSRTFSYFADSTYERLTFENGIGKTEWLWDSKNRKTTHKRYTDGTNSLNWALNYPAANGTSTTIHEQVTDPLGKNVFTYVDDLGRRTSINSPDSGLTNFTYDAGSRLITRIDAFGSPQQFTHTFTHDNIGRRLTEDYGTEIACPSNPIDVQYTYDALPMGSSCPVGATCTRLAGRLAHVKAVLLCSSVPPGSAVYQETFYGYDDAGRVISEYVSDTTGRTAQQNYTWDKNGNLIDVKAPSGASMTSTFGSTGNSDANLITTLARSVSGTPTNLLTTILWAPFGPVTQYDQANTIAGNNLRATLVWNLAYRATQIKYATTGVNKTTIDYTEDEKGRYTQKLYSNVTTGIQSDYLKYDWLDRLTCDAAVTGTCPTSGANLKTNVTAYNSSNDRSSFYHQSPGFGDSVYGVSYYTGTDKISIVDQPSGTTTYDWNYRGDRWFEDNNNSAVDRREYTYDGKSRVRSVFGKWPAPFIGMTDYQITYSFDHKDRLVFRSFTTPALGLTSQTFYYYDLNDRLIEVKHIPNIGDTSTYTIYNFYWLGHRPVAQWATSYPAATTARYFLHADEANRILEKYSWPTSGDASVAWALNPEVFGWDNVVDASSYQPLRVNGLLEDEGTLAYKSDSPLAYDRPTLLIGRGIHYDPMTETDLQRGGAWPNEPYSSGDHSLNGCISAESSNGARPEIDNFHNRSWVYTVTFFYPGSQVCPPISPSSGSMTVYRALGSGRDIGTRLSSLAGIIADATCYGNTTYLRPLYVKCDQDCGQSDMDVECDMFPAFKGLNLDYGQWNGYHFGPGEIRTTVPGVHLSDAIVVAFNSCRCNEDCNDFSDDTTWDPPP